MVLLQLFTSLKWQEVDSTSVAINLADYVNQLFSHLRSISQRNYRCLREGYFCFLIDAVSRNKLSPPGDKRLSFNNYVSLISTIKIII